MKKPHQSLKKTHLKLACVAIATQNLLKLPKKKGRATMKNFACSEDSRRRKIMPKKQKPNKQLKGIPKKHYLGRSNGRKC
jgi:hypothetical protein